MRKTVLQIPMDIELRKAAEKVVLSEGFSSLQEYTRVILTKTAKHELKLVAAIKTKDGWKAPV